METETPDRKLFQKTSGGIDFARLIEQSIPMAVMGVLVIYSNSVVTQNKVDELARQIAALEQDRRTVQTQVNATSEKLIALTAQVTAYLGQQTTLNAAMDARLIYIERAQRAAR